MKPSSFQKLNSWPSVIASSNWNSHWWSLSLPAVLHGFVCVFCACRVVSLLCCVFIHPSAPTPHFLFPLTFHDHSLASSSLCSPPPLLPSEHPLKPVSLSVSVCVHFVMRTQKTRTHQVGRTQVCPFFFCILSSLIQPPFILSLNPRNVCSAQLASPFPHLSLLFSACLHSLVLFPLSSGDALLFAVNRLESSLFTLLKYWHSSFEGL